MGKTYMLRELIDAAVAAKTWEVHVVRADEIESGEPYSFIERFVAVSGMLDWRFTPTAQTSAIDVARECVERLVGETESPRRLIVIDDAQWVDADSQRVLRYLIPRVIRSQNPVRVRRSYTERTGFFWGILARTRHPKPLRRTLHS